MSAAKAARPTFAARVRWRCQADPRWEIETQHGGFATAEDAAMFANGFSTRSPASLTLSRGRLEIAFTDGTAHRMRAGEFQVWRLPEDFDLGQPADDSSFNEVDEPPVALTDMGLDGRWAQLAYGVLGPQGEVVDVIMEIDETGNLKVITVEERPEVGDQETASFSLGVAPRG